MPRRGLTITPAVDKRVQNLRGVLLGEGLDLTYTAMIQVLVMLGTDKLLEGSLLPEWNRKAVGLAKDYAKRAALRL